MIWCHKTLYFLELFSPSSSSHHAILLVTRGSVFCIVGIVLSLPEACRRALSSIVTNLIGLSACRGGACSGVSWLGLGGKSSLSEKNLLLTESGSPTVCMQLLSEKSKSRKRPDLLMLVGKALKVGTACILSLSSIASP